jgi:hypothetical protein
VALGRKKPGNPPNTVIAFAVIGPQPGIAASICSAGPCRMRCQNSRSRGRRFPGRLPAMIPALMAPIEVPITQSGSTPASSSAW